MRRRSNLSPAPLYRMNSKVFLLSTLLQWGNDLFHDTHTKVAFQQIALCRNWNNVELIMISLTKNRLLYLLLVSLTVRVRKVRVCKVRVRKVRVRKVRVRKVRVRKVRVR